MTIRRWLYTMPLRIRSLLLRHRVERELDEEFQFHFEQQVEVSIARGMTLADAQAEARKALDGIQLKKEACRDMRGLNFLDALARDLRYAARMLRKSPVFTIAAIFALALGIGANTAVFTAYKAMIARPLQARDPGEMVNIALIRGSGAATATFSYPDYEAYRAAHSFRGMIAIAPERMRLSNAGDIVSQGGSGSGSGMGRFSLLPTVASNAEFASVFAISDNYFQVLGVAALRGRTFEFMGVAELIASPSVLISENYWQTRFAGDPAILGKVIHLNGMAVTIVGITPHDFAGTETVVPDFWLPLSLEPLVHGDAKWLRDRENQCCRLFGRLAPGITIAQAQAETALVADRLRLLHDADSEPAKRVTALVFPGSPFPVPLKLIPRLKLAVLFVMLAAAMLLAVACANVGSLQLARARSRQNELRTRLSLGASRLRIISQLLTESALLGLLAGIVALLCSLVLLKIAAALAAQALPADYGTLIFDVTPDLGVFIYVLAISLAAGVLFGLAPALESSRSALSSDARGSTASVRSRRIQDFLVGAQIALSLVLMFAGSMLIHSAIRSLKTNIGYDSKHVVNLDLQFPGASKYTAERKLALIGELRARLAALPGVAAITSARPPARGGFRTAVSRDGETSAAQNAQSILHYTYIEPNYFQTLRIPLLAGHSFQPQAGQGEQAVVLSESAAKQLWPNENPVGRRIRLNATDEKVHKQSELSADGPAYQVIGVARDTRGVEFDGSDSKQVYLPLPEYRFQNRPILIRTQSDPAQLMKAIDPVIASVDPDLVANSSTLDAMLWLSPPVASASVAAAIASTIGLLGLLLASIGIYGTVSYIVLLRTREVGIRMAVGAQKRDVLGLILGEIARPVLAGLLAGMCLAVGASYLLRGLLWGLSAVDGISFAGVSLLFLLIALLAIYPPARRAMRVDPVVALRYE